jgi:hypothetical protein
MAGRNGGVWEERLTRDWFWIERKAKAYFSSDWITCVDAVQIIRGQKPKPKTCREVNDITCFEPVPAGVIKLLTRAMDTLNKELI